MLPHTEQDPYLISTKNEQTLRFSKMEADDEATLLQQAGENVEVHHRGMLQYRLNGIYQGNLF
tara:strand:+ start:66 stop:254 length:189 start_codon:yes stop_codon:yes gene_type:complete